MAKKVVLAGACRTAIGKMGGALSNTPAADLGAIVIKEALRRAGVKPEMVDEVKMGCVIQAAQGQNVARQASIKAGLPIEVPAITINVVCGSGLKCVNDAATMIMAGEADIVVAGGMENMSMAPYAMTKARFGYRMNNATIIDTMVNDALTDAFNHYHMMVKNIVGEDNAGENWAMLLEYGTQNREIIALQNMGLSRYSAQKIFKECRGAFISENGQLKKVDKHKVLSKLQKDSIEYIEAQKLL